MYIPDKQNLDDSGIAYGWLVLSIFLIIAGILYSYLTGVVNAFIQGPGYDNSVGINHDIASGKMSTQGVNALKFNIAMFTNVPLWVIVGGFVYCIARAIVVKQVA